MAIGTTITSFLNTQNKASASSWSPVTAAAIPIGNLAFVVVSLDNNTQSTGISSLVTSVSIDGRAMTKIIEYTNIGSGGTDGGATVSIWALLVTGTQIASGSTVAITFATSPTAKGAVGGYFSFDTNKSIGIVSNANFGTAIAAASTAGSAPSEAMYLLCAATEGNTQCFTTASSGTILAENTAFTTGGGTATNMSSGCIWNKSATGSEVNTVASAGLSGDYAAVKLGLYELPPQVLGQDSTHAHTSDQATLTHKYVIAGQDAVHNHGSDQANVVFKPLLTPQDSTHQHFADQSVITIKTLQKAPINSATGAYLISDPGTIVLFGDYYTFV